MSRNDVWKKRNPGRLGIMLAFIMLLTSIGMVDATFIGYIREYKSYNEIETAIDLAVDRCIKEGILKDYLTAHKAEVCKMVLYEYNEAETMEMFKQEGFDEGFDEGLDTGLGLKLIRQGLLLRSTGSAGGSDVEYPLFLIPLFRRFKVGCSWRLRLLFSEVVRTAGSGGKDNHEFKEDKMG